MLIIVLGMHIIYSPIALNMHVSYGLPNLLSNPEGYSLHRCHCWTSKRPAAAQLLSGCFIWRILQDFLVLPLRQQGLPQLWTGFWARPAKLPSQRRLPFGAHSDARRSDCRFGDKGCHSIITRLQMCWGCFRCFPLLYADCRQPGPKFCQKLGASGKGGSRYVPTRLVRPPKRASSSVQI